MFGFWKIISIGNILLNNGRIAYWSYLKSSNPSLDILEGKVRCRHCWAFLIILQSNSDPRILKNKLLWDYLNYLFGRWTVYIVYYLYCSRKNHFGCDLKSIYLIIFLTCFTIKSLFIMVKNELSYDTVWHPYLLCKNDFWQLMSYTDI